MLRWPCEILGVIVIQHRAGSWDPVVAMWDPGVLWGGCAGSNVARRSQSDAPLLASKLSSTGLSSILLQGTRRGEGKLRRQLGHARVWGLAGQHGSEEWAPR